MDKIINEISNIKVLNLKEYNNLISRYGINDVNLAFKQILNLSTKKQELLKAGVLTSIEIGNEISRQMVIEALLSNETILSNTNNLLQQEISSEAVKRLLYKQNNPDIYGQYGLKTVVYLLGRSLERIDNKTITPKFKQFTIDEKLTGSNVIEELLKQYIVTFNKLRS